MTIPDGNISLGFSDESFPTGTHMCLFYTDERVRRDVITKFLRAGLSAGERVCYFVNELRPEDLIRDIKDRGIEFSDEDIARQLYVASTEAAYYPEGRFEPDNMLDNLRSFYSASLKEGFSGVRGIGEMDWASHNIPGTERLVEYESRVNFELKNSPVTTICQYNTNLFDGKTIMDILRVHQAVILRGQIMRNPFYSLLNKFS